MKVWIEKLAPNEWASLSEDAHKVVFGEIRPPSMNRIDYALLAIDESGNPIGYVTVREFDSESIYWAHGGAMPTGDDYEAEVRKHDAFHSAILTWARARYSRVSMLVENENVRYLHRAMRSGFRIMGVRVFKGQVFCELLLEFQMKGER